MTYATETTPTEGPLDQRVGPPRRIRVSFACNHHENGMFAGRAWMAQPESLYRVGRHSWDAELVHDDWGRGVALTVDHARMRLRIHRVWFGFKAHRPMFGNWCWDAFEFERGTGKRLLALMREQGAWHCEAGPSTFYRWWNRRPNDVGTDVFGLLVVPPGEPLYPSSAPLEISAVAPQPCCQDWNNCGAACVCRANYWRERATGTSAA